MRADPIIRPFHRTDFDEVVSQWHHTNRVTYAYNAEHQRHTLDDARNFFRNAVLDTCEVLVATQEGTLGGVIAVQASWIRQFAVFPAFQRQGIGRALLLRAKETSPRELRLFTFQRNTPARKFYEAQGFVSVAFGTSPAPESEPDVEYRWRA